MKWPLASLGDVATVAMGQSPPGETYNTDGQGLPFFQGSAEFGDPYPIVSKWCTEPFRIAEPEDVLLSVRAPVGPTNIATERCCIGRGLAGVRGKAGVLNQRYLAFFMRFVAPGLSRRGQGSTFDAVNRSDIEELRIPLPALSEQHRIVEILDEVDRLRRLRDKADAKSERILPAVVTKTVGAPGTWSSNRRTSSLGELVNLVSGGTPSKGENRFWSGEIPWVSPKDMKQDFIWNSQDHISDDAIDNSNLKVVQPGAVLMVVRGMILARTVPVSLVRRSVTINQDLKALIPKTPEISGEYLWALLSVARSHLLVEVQTAAHGTRKLDTSNLLQIRIPVPSNTQSSLVTSAVQTHEALVNGRSQARERVRSLFTTLLTQAFKGHLTARWREPRMTELRKEMQEQTRLLAKVPQPC